MLSAANYQALDKRPDFINLSPQPLSQFHQRQANLGQDAAMVSASFIHFNLNALNTIKGNKGKFYNIKNTQMSGQEIALRLPNVEKPVLLYVDNVQNLVEDVVTYTGYRVENSNDFFTLSVSDDGVMAKINYGNYIYVIKPIKSKGSKHTIVQLEKSLMVKDTGEDVLESQTNKQLKNHVEKSSNSSGRVDVLFYYASDVNNPALLVSTVLSEMNAALVRSGISSNNYVFSVGIKPAKTSFQNLCRYNFNGNGSIDSYIRARQGEFSTMDQDMNTLGADIAFVLVGEYTATGCYPGYPGRVGGFAGDYNNSSQAYAVSVDSYALGDLTALHEMGHVFGGKHSVDSNTINNTWNTAKGYTYIDPSTLTNPWTTIMGGYNEPFCTFSGNGPTFLCKRINYFSNSYKYYQGVPVGDYQSNMKNWLNYNLPNVSSWRQSATQAVDAPNPISSSSELCYGLHSVQWGSQQGATEYKLFKSSSFNFTNPTLVYNGSNTNTVINVNYGTWYLRAQACNDIACSIYSSQVSATRYSSCL